MPKEKARGEEEEGKCGKIQNIIINTTAVLQRH